MFANCLSRERPQRRTIARVALHMLALRNLAGKIGPGLEEEIRAEESILRSTCTNTTWRRANQATRIYPLPDGEPSLDEMKVWFLVLVAQGLDYHLDDEPDEITDSDGASLFLPVEIAEINDALARFQEAFGWNKIWEVYKPISDLRD